jgi:hypothetical protein
VTSGVETAIHDGDTPPASAHERALVAKRGEVAAHARAIELHEQALAEQAAQEARTVVGGDHVGG